MKGSTAALPLLIGVPQFVTTASLSDFRLPNHDKSDIRQLPQDNASKADPLFFLDGVSRISHGSLANTSTNAFGYSDIPNKIPMTDDAHIPIASNSKLFTAVAIYQLYEQGVLDVDADIATMLDETDFTKFGITGVTKYCPQLGYKSMFNKCEKITLRQLLSMSSGIYPQLNCGPVATTAGQCNDDPYLVNPDSVSQVVGEFILEPLFFEPGKDFFYSNPTFILATYFVEKYSGMPYRKYLEKNIFSKVGMENTYYDFFNGQLELDEKRVNQYFRFYDNSSYDLLSVGRATLDLHLGANSGSGGLISTTEDVARFYYSLFNKTTKGAPFFANASTIDSIIAPESLMGALLIPVGSSFLDDHYRYFGQGIETICFVKDCPDGPDYIYYTGNSYTTSTANVLDYHSNILSQVWTTTRSLATTKEAFETVKESQTGHFTPIVLAWAVDQWDATALAFQQLFSASPARNLASSGDQTPSSDPSEANTESIISGAKGRAGKWATLVLLVLAMYYIHL